MPPLRGEILLFLRLQDRKKWFVYALAAAVSLPLGYWLVSSSLSTYSFLTFYRPEQVFQKIEDPAVPPQSRGTEILEALNAEIQQESFVKKGEESWLLARLDGLWHSVRRYVSPGGKDESALQDEFRRTALKHQPPSEPLPLKAVPHESPETDAGEQSLRNILSLSKDPEVLGTATADRLEAKKRLYEPLLAVSSEATSDMEGQEGRKTADWLYRFESLKGLRTQSLIYQFNRNLALEGTVEAEPRAETDPDLSDFGFRTVHALNLLRDSPAPGSTMAYDAVHSGYPLSYGIGLNYRVSPLVNLRFDYSYETPHDDLVEYRGTWESSLMTNYDKSPPEDSLSVHNFFVGLRYLYQQRATRVPLHTGFFYSTNMDDEPLSSNVSLGFSIGGGINRRDLHLGFAWRFRVWDNPEPQFLQQQELQELETRVSNQFLFTLLF